MNFPNVITKTNPTQKPYTIFLDDTESHFTSSNTILGLHLQEHEYRFTLSTRARQKWKASPELFNSYEQTSGIHIDTFRTLKSYIRKNHKEIKSIILDWDKTLTVHSTFRANVIDKYITECFFGGKRRMKYMRTFFKTCRKKNIPVHILTCNRKAKTMEGKRIFLKALKYINVHNVDVNFTDNLKTPIIHKMNSN
jgi:hypothetical protein